MAEAALVHFHRLKAEAEEEARWEEAALVVVEAEAKA